MLRSIRSSYRVLVLTDNNIEIQNLNKAFKMKEASKMPDVILDLTDETKTIEEAIAECDKTRKALLPWYKKFALRIKRIF